MLLGIEQVIKSSITFLFSMNIYLLLWYEKVKYKNIQKCNKRISRRNANYPNKLSESFSSSYFWHSQSLRQVMRAQTMTIVQKETSQIFLRSFDISTDFVYHWDNMVFGIIHLFPNHLSYIPLPNTSSLW